MTRHDQDAVPRGAPPPWTRLLDVKDVPAQGLALRLEADAGTCAAVARDLGLEGIASLAGDYRVCRAGKDGLVVVGQVEADVLQRCVLTLDLFPARVREPVEASFAPEIADPARARLERAGSLDLEGQGDDEPDPIVSGKIDLGALTAEFLALGLDPYPRKPGAAFVEPAPAAPSDGPMGELARLRAAKSGSKQ